MKSKLVICELATCFFCDPLLLLLAYAISFLLNFQVFVNSLISFINPVIKMSLSPVNIQVTFGSNLYVG